VVTGKPIEIGGSLGRDLATSLGASFVLREYLNKIGKMDNSSLKVAVQGMGNAGGNIAKILSD
jgi:glutamate dehydrogenase/leucine dehydrogenase